MQLFVTSSAAFMEGFVIMESVNSVAPTMLATHARTAPHLSLVFQFVKMCWKEIFLASTVHPVNLVYCSNLKKLLSCPITTVYFQVVLESYLTFLEAAIVMLPQSAWPAG